MYPEIFWGDQGGGGGWGGGGGGVLCTLLMGPGQSPGGDHVAKLPEAPRI